MQKPVESGNTNAAQFSQLHRHPDSIVARCPTSSTLYEGLTIAAGSSSQSRANMEHTGTTLSGSPRRPRMVVKPAQQIQRTTTPTGGLSLTDQVRRNDGRRRLGCHLRYTRTTGGRWSPEEQTWHINALELQAARFAVQTFAKEVTGTVALQLDNQVAVQYINRMGGVRSRHLGVSIEAP